MQKLLLFTSTLFFTLWTGVVGANVCTDMLIAEAARKANAFGARVLENLKARSPVPDNVVLSAPALNAALALVAEGAGPQGRQELLPALGYRPQELDLLRQSAQQIAKDLGIQSAFFTDKALALRPEFVQRLQGQNVQLGQLPFQLDPLSAAQGANKWAAKATKDLVQEIITPDTAAGLVGLLASSVYFKGTWKYQFDPRLTLPGAFTTAKNERKSVPMMEQTIPHLDAYMANSYLVTRLPYVGEEKAMYIVFPNMDWQTRRGVLSPAEALLQAEAAGDFARFASHDGIKTFTDEKVGLPRFKLKYSGDEFKQILQDMGVQAIFTPGHMGDLSPDSRLFVSYVRLDSVLEVNEEGSEAAAVASVGMALESMQIDEFVFDRPFALVIRDEKSGLNIISAVVEDPSR